MGGGRGEKRKARMDEMEEMKLGKEGKGRESKAKLWLLRSMLYRVAALPSSPKGPELRFGLPTRRWISAFVWAYFFFLLASSLPPFTPDFTHSAFNRVRVCCSLKWGQLDIFCKRFKFRFAFFYDSGMNCQVVEPQRSFASDFRVSAITMLCLSYGRMKFFCGQTLK